MKKTKKRESKGYLPYILVVSLVALVAVFTIGIHEAQTNYEFVYDEEGNVVGQAYSRGWWDAFWSFASESGSVRGGPGGGAGGSKCSNAKSSPACAKIKCCIWTNGKCMDDPDCL
ncbi:MAG: hypothetical protein PHE43_00535 [Candidatus Nanoarchaeia archaeon]|nr:hypothetical protein [Candidatus Nanoarchaeia archaeon]